MSKFRADQVLVKVEAGPDGAIITDIIIFENKLKPSTQLSLNQLGAVAQSHIRETFTIAGNNRQIVYKSMKRVDSGIGDDAVERLMESNTKLTQNISFKQISDSDLGEVVTSVKDL